MKTPLELRPGSSKDEDSRTRAAKRTAELRQHNNANIDNSVDKFATPPAPDGWTYEWKMKMTMGWEDPSFHNRTQLGGWESVEVKRHPEMMPKGAIGIIEREGMVMCERPEEITKERQAMDRKAARDQIQIKQGQLDPKGRGGIISREDAQISPKVSKDYNFSVPEQ